MPSGGQGDDDGRQRDRNRHANATHASAAVSANRFAADAPPERSFPIAVTTGLTGSNPVVDLCGGAGATAKAILDLASMQTHVISPDNAAAMQRAGRHSPTDPRLRARGIERLRAGRSLRSGGTSRQPRASRMARRKDVHSGPHRSKWPAEVCLPADGALLLRPGIIVAWHSAS
jgi:hypothetical protein